MIIQKIAEIKHNYISIRNKLNIIHNTNRQHTLNNLL